MIRLHLGLLEYLLVDPKCPMVLILTCLRTGEIFPFEISCSKLLKRKLQTLLSSCSLSEFRGFLNEFPIFQSFVIPRLEPIMSNSFGVGSLTFTEVGDFISFSKSVIWERQSIYYSHQKLKAWDSGTVPFQISSNRFVAKYYSDIIDSIVFAIPNNRNQNFKVQIVEIGAGHGILSVLLAREMKSRSYSSHVLCTDIHTTIFKDLLTLPWIRQLCDEGSLDFATCSATSDPDQEENRNNSYNSTTTDVKGLHMLHSNKSSFDCSCPNDDCYCCCDVLVIIGNYAFDSFPVDLIGCNGLGDVFEIGEKRNINRHGKGRSRKSVSKSESESLPSPLNISTSYNNSENIRNPMQKSKSKYLARPLCRTCFHPITVTGTVTGISSTDTSPANFNLCCATCQHHVENGIKVGVKDGNRNINDNHNTNNDHNGNGNDHYKENGLLTRMLLHTTQKNKRKKKTDIDLDNEVGVFVFPTAGLTLLQ
eukprot:gene11987-25106_t